MTLSIYLSVKVRSMASLVAQLVKNLPAMWETWVRSLSWEDPLEKGTATQSSILVSPWGCKELERLSDFHFHFVFLNCSLKKQQKASMYSVSSQVAMLNPKVSNTKATCVTAF